MSAAQQLSTVEGEVRPFGVWFSKRARGEKLETIEETLEEDRCLCLAVVLVLAAIATLVMEIMLH